jgi:hypothetical protein
MSKTTSGRSPYEIRLELLQLAQEHLQATFDRQMTFSTEVLRLASDAQAQSVDDLKALMPKVFTFQDILDKATELYSFVQKRD